MDVQQLLDRIEEKVPVWVKMEDGYFEGTPVLYGMMDGKMQVRVDLPPDGPCVWVEEVYFNEPEESELDYQERRLKETMDKITQEWDSFYPKMKEDLEKITIYAKGIINGSNN